MTELSRLKWQCRRGCKELDLLLNDYLEHHYVSATSQKQAYFQHLLTLDDIELLLNWHDHVAYLNQQA